jgi:methanogenic corrinoid protein MtbC1
MRKTESTAGYLSIAAVERDTGLGKDTLRAWERRYGFPSPERNANGERLYPMEQVIRLRVLKRLIDRGHRPSKLMHMATAGLLGSDIDEGLDSGVPPAAPIRSDLLGYVEMCSVERAGELRRALHQELVRTGLRSFVLDTVVPLIRAVGDHWEQERLCVFEEHLFTEQLQTVLRTGISALSLDAHHARPRVLLTTLPQESHGLGLLMAEAILTLEGAQCVSLGVQTPIDQIVRASEHADVIGLSFSTTLHANRMLEGLAELSSSVRDGVEIWCGGAAPALGRCTLPNVHQVDLHSAADHIARWRHARSG